ncbi:integral peroxisomal membrane peroxin-domain-containing protein [Cunninghamella echinulata]|nr:integral peroxisomal membrane peroxin-domain-containing protein [Cunninghamella echinulata]
MPSPIKFHRFKLTTFHGLVYCDYCSKVLWGLARQGVQCTECGYHCHETCKDMALQCRPPRRFSPDSLSMTDSEAESVGKYSLSSPRGSMDIKYNNNHQHHHHHHYSSNASSNGHITDDNTLPSPRTTTTSTTTTTKRHPQQQLHLDAMNYNLQQKEEALKSPSIYSNYSSNTNDHHRPSTHPSPSPQSQSQQHAPVKAYRKALKQQLQQYSSSSTSPSSSFHTLSSNNNAIPGETSEGKAMMTPQQTAKTFTRLVARSRAFFHLTRYFYDVYNWKSTTKSLIYVSLWTLFCLYPMVVTLLPPVLIVLLFFRSGIQHRPANLVLLPRYDESSPEYYVNLERMQTFMVFMIRLYDNLSYHLQHASLNENVYRLLFVMSLGLTVLLYFVGRWVILLLGLVLLLNKTWVGTTLETSIQLAMEILQTMVDVFQRLCLPHHHASKTTVEVSLYENQRWWASNGYTSQLLRSERTPWSNITGTEPLPNKDDMPPPSHYEWVDDGWLLDMTGPWSDDILGLVTMIECDSEGWVYTDHKWTNPRSRPDTLPGEKDSARPLTRRRRWYRKAKLIMDKPTSKKKAN